MSKHDDINHFFDEYQEQARQTAIYPKEHKITYPILGLASEAGEVAGKYKKVLRDGTPLNREQLAAELGDVLWYIANTAADANISLGYIAIENLRKLGDRQDRGVLGGSGDTR